MALEGRNGGGGGTFTTIVFLCFFLSFCLPSVKRLNFGGGGTIFFFIFLFSFIILHYIYIHQY